MTNPNATIDATLCPCGTPDDERGWHACPDLPAAGAPASPMTDVEHMEAFGFTMAPGKDRQHTTITVRMGGIGEAWRLPDVPMRLIPVVTDIAASGILRFGQDYSRAAAEATRDASRFLGWGDEEAAERYLRNAWSRIS